MAVAANIQSIVITNCLGLLVLATLLVTSRMARERRHPDDRMFTAMIYVAGATCVCEMATWLVDGQPGALPHAVNVLGNTFSYIATAGFSYLWCLYQDLRLHRGSKQRPTQIPYLLGFVAFVVFLTLVNLFVPFMFYVSEDNVYHRLAPSYLTYVVAMMSLTYSVFFNERFQRRHGKVRFFPIWIFIAPIVIGATAQAVMFGVSTAWCSVCLALNAIYMSQQNELSYVDALTGLYNRAFLDSALRGHGDRRRVKAGIMIDIDFFKAINDTYGHAQGDQALRDTASILRKSTPRDAIIVRFAGDEFIVLLTTRDAAEIRTIQQDIRNELEAYNANSKMPFELQLSMGYGIREPDMDEDRLLRTMDAHMYNEKSRKHASRDGNE